MAKAKPITGLDCSADPIRSAVLILSTRFEETMQFSGAALSADDSIDGIHDMRVASRRLRSAVRDFSKLFRKKRIKTLKKRLKRLATNLGSVRDLDVYIQWLETTNERSPTSDIRVGVDTLISAAIADRATKHATLVNAIGPETIVRLEKVLADAVGQDLREDVIGLPNDFRSFGVNVICDLIDAVSKRSEAIRRPLDVTGLHKLRIATKRLRYAFDLFDTCFGDNLHVYAKTLSKLQSRLGMIHDIDVWLDGLVTDSSSETTGACSIDWLKTEMSKQRTENYESALAIWNDTIAPQLIGEIRLILSK